MKETVLNLIKQEDYATLQIKFNKMHTATVANILGELEFEQLIKIFRILKKDTAARVFAFLPIDLQKDIISHLSFKEAGSIVDELFADDAADLLDEMPASMVTRILANATAETRRDINNLLKYDEETAGSKMTVEFVSFKKNIKVSDAILKIKKEGVDKETINNCYVVDESRHLLGSVPIRSLLLNSDDTKVADIMVNQEVYVTTSQNIEEVATIFKNYGIITLPVVDMEKRIVGIITVASNKSI